MTDQDEIGRLNPMLNNLGMEVKNVDKLNPRLRIRDISSSTDKSSFVKDLIKQNLEGVSEDKVRLVYWSPAKGRMGPVAVIEVFLDTRVRLLNQGRVYLGLSYCRVADHLRILQCFKCLGFSHTANNCQVRVDICGHCGEGHESRASPRTGTRKCHNYVSAKMPVTDHSAMDASVCPILQQRLGDRTKMIRY